MLKLTILLLTMFMASWKVSCDVDDPWLDDEDKQRMEVIAR